METIVRCNIYRIRQEKNYTQEYMADELCISQSQYCKKENGTQKFSFEEIVKIAEILKVETKELLETKAVS